MTSDPASAGGMACALDGGGSGEPGRAHRAERGGGQTEGMEIGSRDLLCGHV